MSLFEVEGWGLDKKVAKTAVFSSAKQEKKKAKKDAHKKLKSNNNDNKKRSLDDINDDDDDDKIEEQPLEPKKTQKDSKPKQQEKKQPQQKQKEQKQQQQQQQLIPTSTKLTPLQQKMMAKLSGSRFRWINEQLYTIKSQEALNLIKDQPELFDEYHKGFRSQVQSWPENPVDIFVSQIRIRGTTRNVNAPGGLPGIGPDKKVVIADMGCGEAQLAYDVEKFLKSVKNGGHGNNNNNKRQKFNSNARYGKNLKIDVHSFDLKKVNNKITVADIKNVPLPDESCTIVIFCLALMGTNFLDFIKEAYRLIAPRGELWIAEIKSRLSDEKGDEFINVLKKMGFFHKFTDDSNKMFTRFEFFKPPTEILEERKLKEDSRTKFIEDEKEIEKLEKKREVKPEGEWLLKPCIYKRR
ncbi:hypothetical protein CANARDRAFT_192706 [[Candida] arabinofermentans NRRL YB-2248]|uniref:Ribosomal RNA-processing protein 8 n=1 Tax=[Candida] arabinofermentans NRRL YB-2248 TaxID=983967 RepID=A0A1E4T8V1_9ASCO|nr:hypothetical protein CANARDRAFT_192706 [[Candida] arabinofermentans NRRL YB-2248]